jgi:hypothetical protein
MAIKAVNEKEQRATLSQRISSVALSFAHTRRHRPSAPFPLRGIGQCAPLGLVSAPLRTLLPVHALLPQRVQCVSRFHPTKKRKGKERKGWRVKVSFPPNDVQLR